MSTDLRLRIEPVRVRYRKVPRPCCAGKCERAAKAVIAWMRPGALEAREICPAHLSALRAEVEERGGGALFFPVDVAPPLERLAQLVEEEIRRRQPPPVYVTTTSTGGFGYIGNVTGAMFNVSFK